MWINIDMAIQAIDIEGDKELIKTLDKLRESSADLRPIFESITSDFYKSNKKLIFSASPGQYRDLKDTTKKTKQREVGFIYPILVMRGRLKNSLRSRGDSEAIQESDKKNLVLGTTTPYGGFLQEGTKHMPPRPFLLVDVGNRAGRWLRIAQTELERVMKT